MKKSLVEVHYENDINENDIIAYHKEKWIAVSKSVFLNDIYSEISNLKDIVAKETEKRNETVTNLDHSLDELNYLISSINNKVRYILGESEEEENETKD